MAKRISVVLLLLAWSAILEPASSAEPQADSVTFGGSNFYPPFHYQGRRGEPLGFDAALFQTIARSVGWHANFRFDDWQAVQDKLAEGGLDIVPMFVSPERRQRFRFTDPIFIETHLIWGPPDSPSLNNIESLQGFRLSAESGAYALQEILRQGLDVELVEASSEAAALRMVTTGEVDFAIVPANVGSYTVREEALSLEAVSPPLLPVAYAFAVSPARPELVDAVNRELDLLRRNGGLEDLREEWLTGGENPWWTFVGVLALSLVLMTVAMLYSPWRKRLNVVASRLRPVDGKRQAAGSRSGNPITELPNREYFLELLTQELAILQVPRQCVAVFSINDLPLIEQAAGFSLADRLVMQVASALESGQSAMAYTSHGHFALLFRNVTDIEDAIRQVNQAMEHAAGEYRLGEDSLLVNLSAGLALFPDHDVTATELLRKAHLALAQARKGNRPLQLYKQEAESYANNVLLVTDLRRALKSSALSWVYQPQYNVEEKGFSGVEMLVRWKHPHYGAIPPDYFIPLAEQSGLIEQVTQEVVRQALFTFERWKRAGRAYRLSINVSANDLADTYRVEKILDELEDYAEFLTLEITETAIMKDVEAIVSNAELLKAAKVKLSLDDYGTGYSSLAYLKEFNFDELKIDKRFIRNICNSQRDSMITRACIRLGHDLGAHVVAEGVETLECAELLKGMGCDILQGYGLARPLELEDVERLCHPTPYSKLS